MTDDCSSFNRCKYTLISHHTQKVLGYVPVETLCDCYSQKEKIIKFSLKRTDHEIITRRKQCLTQKIKTLNIIWSVPFVACTVLLCTNWAWKTDGAYKMERWFCKGTAADRWWKGEKEVLMTVQAKRCLHFLHHFLLASGFTASSISAWFVGDTEVFHSSSGCILNSEAERETN